MGGDLNYGLLKRGKMQNRLNDLFVRFKVKGFLSIEMPDLVRDALNLVNNEKCFSINDVNHELEELGWGIGIMDHETYGLITALFEKNCPLDVECYIHNR